jgi:hypothetical protein
VEERRTEKDSKRERERNGEKESKREGEVSPKWVPKGGCPQPGSPSVENAQLVSQASLC